MPKALESHPCAHFVLQNVVPPGTQPVLAALCSAEGALAPLEVLRIRQLRTSTEYLPAFAGMLRQLVLPPLRSEHTEFLALTTLSGLQVWLCPVAPPVEFVALQSNFIHAIIINSFERLVRMCTDVGPWKLAKLQTCFFGATLSRAAPSY